MNRIKSVTHFLGVLFFIIYSNICFSSVSISSSDIIRDQTNTPSSLKTDEKDPWKMHLIDPAPPSGSDGVKLADVNGDGFLDLASGFEEGNVSRIYINPKQKNVTGYWNYIELPSPNVEDAVLVDLDRDGQFDLVTASEDPTNEIRIHWAPENPKEYLEANKWKTVIVPVTKNMSAWMFIVPMDMDGQNGLDLIIGSKSIGGQKGEDKAMVGWLRSPEDQRNINEWKYFPLSKAGWIMSIEVTDMNRDQYPDILLSDRRKSTQTGVRWLENPGDNKEQFFREWPSHKIGICEGEPMFLTQADLDQDGTKEILVPDIYSGLAILKQGDGPDQRWNEYKIPYPEWAGPRGKAVSTGDINLDGQNDIVLSFEEEGKVSSIPYDEYIKTGKNSVIWGSFHKDPFQGEWNFFKVSGLKGRKFDLINLIDLDKDGDLDVLTNDENEETDGLGVVWYENPIK